MYSQKTIDRFKSYVRRLGPNECWLWTGANAGNSYGGFRLNNPRRVKPERPDRYRHVTPMPN